MSDQKKDERSQKDLPRPEKTDDHRTPRDTIATSVHFTKERTDDRSSTRFTDVERSVPASQNGDPAALNQFSRSQMIYGAEGMDALAHARVAVFGLGGVGGHVCESLVRTGIGAIDIIDHDIVELTNLNRQTIATRITIGEKKIDAMEQRLHDINPQCLITKYDRLFLPDTSHLFDFEQYDYIVDAVDTVTAKLELIMCARTAGTPIISAMGAGGKTQPTALRIDDIYRTSICRLARIMRKELRKRGVDHLKVCYSTEPPLAPSKNASDLHGTDLTSTAVGSNAFVPAAMGLAIASEVVNDLVSI